VALKIAGRSSKKILISSACGIMRDPPKGASRPPFRGPCFGGGGGAARGAAGFRQTGQGSGFPVPEAVKKTHFHDAFSL
jgi:hypothetical protein